MTWPITNVRMENKLSALALQNDISQSEFQRHEVIEYFMKLRLRTDYPFFIPY